VVEGAAKCRAVLDRGFQQSRGAEFAVTAVQFEQHAAQERHLTMKVEREVGNDERARRSVEEGHLVQLRHAGEHMLLKHAGPRGRRRVGERVCELQIRPGRREARRRVESGLWIRGQPPLEIGVVHHVRCDDVRDRTKAREFVTQPGRILDGRVHPQGPIGSRAMVIRWPSFMPTTVSGALSSHSSGANGARLISRRRSARRVRYSQTSGAS
jgi:hypothetical protein